MVFSIYRKMFSELVEEDLSKCSSDLKKYSCYPELNGAFSLSPTSPSSDISGTFGSSPNSSNSDDFSSTGCSNWDEEIMEYCMKYDIEKHPALLNLISPMVPPNDVLPITTTNSSCKESLIAFNSPSKESSITIDPSSKEMPIILDSPYKEMPISLDSPCKEIPVGFETIFGICDEFINDEFINAFAKDEDSLQEIIDHGDISMFMDQNKSVNSTVHRKPYHPDYDHCYSAPARRSEWNEEKDFSWTSPCSPDSSDSSSEEVDVVTVPEELQTPIVPKVEAPCRNRRPRRGQKNVKKTRSSLSAKSLKAAMKRNHITTIRRTYRRKINNSVETTPSNSVPSSAHSSRCSSDVEDAGKRANHNSSERKRREILRTALQNLRLCVPSVQNNPKAPKVQILNSAEKFIRELKHCEQESTLVKDKEIQKQKAMRAKLKSLMAHYNHNC